MRQVSGRELCRIVSRRGWALLRINGSHHIYSQPSNPTQLSIPVHGNKPLKTGTLRTLLKQAGIDPNSI